MRPYGGFDHNDQTLRILVQLEQHYAEFDGLNLTWEMLEGVVKHNGPMAGPHSKGALLPPTLVVYNRRHDLALDTFDGTEDQATAIADDTHGRAPCRERECQKGERREGAVYSKKN